MQRRKLFLHIGLPKTGTSALQVFFYENREALRKFGVCYPEHCLAKINIERVYGAHHHLASSVRVAKEATSARQQFTHDLVKIHVESKESRQVLLSSEVFSEELHEHALAQLRDFFEPIKIIIYLRRQDEFGISAYNQYIKAGYPTQFATKKIQDIKPGRLNFYKKIEPWANLFGADSIVVRTYDKSTFCGPDIFSDFLQGILGISAAHEFNRPTLPQNPSLGDDSLEFKRLVNCLGLPYVQTMPVVPLLAKHDSTIPFDVGRKTRIISPAERFSLVEAFADSNAQVAREYLGRANGKLFNMPQQAIEDGWQKYPGIDAETVAVLAALVRSNDEQLFDVIRGGVETSLRSDDPQARDAAAILAVGFIGDGDAMP